MSFKCLQLRQHSRRCSSITVFVEVRHFAVSELSRDVRVPEQPLQDEQRQTQGVAVALQRDQLPEDRLRTRQHCAYCAASGACREDTDN